MRSSSRRRTGVGSEGIDRARRRLRT
jgi:hypothetical protein